MFFYNDDILQKVQKQLERNCPSPENELIRLSSFAAHLQENEVGIRIRNLVLDIDDFICQTRWNIGQALLLIEKYPQIVNPIEPENWVEKDILKNGIPSSALLLIRGFIRDADKVLYSDLSESRRSGTVAGWIYHMMIDDAIYRVIAALDRLAQILWFIAELPTVYQNGEKIKVYFRSRKIEEIDRVIKNEQSKELVNISTNSLLEYVIGYRDSFTHDLKAYSQIAGSRPNDEWIDKDGNCNIIKHDNWDGENLFALANATYHQLTDALKPIVKICEDYLISKTNLNQ